MIGKTAAAISAVIADMAISHNFECYDTKEKAQQNIRGTVPACVINEMDVVLYHDFIDAIVNVAIALESAEVNEY